MPPLYKGGGRCKCLYVLIGYILKAFQATQPQPEQPVAGADAADPTGAGGGTIGIGMAPGPQEQGFTGNEQRPAEAGGPTEGAGGEQPVA